MPRVVDQARRAALLDAVTEGLLDLGVIGVSLEQLATRAGTSARMLVHHFASRDALIDAAVERARTWHLARAREVLLDGSDFFTNLEQAWEWFSGAEATRYFALFQQIAAAERLGHGRSAQLTPRLTLDWFPLLEEGLRSMDRAPALVTVEATNYLAQVRGLLLDLQATGDHHRVGRAYQRWVRSLRDS